MSRRLGELRDQKKVAEEERERRAIENKRQIDTLEEQLREERQRSKDREREHAQERDELFRGLQAATSAKADETFRKNRSLVDAEARCESVLQELNNLRQQVQLQRSREQEMEDALRAARRDLAESKAENRLVMLF